jgi:hypothetical protein
MYPCTVLAQVDYDLIDVVLENAAAASKTFRDFLSFSFVDDCARPLCSLL